MGKKTYTKEDILKFGEYYWAHESGTYCIRREVYLRNGDKASERLPAGRWKSDISELINSDDIELRLTGICKKFNIKEFGRAYEAKLVKKIIIESNPWITISIRKDFEKVVYSERKNEKDARYIYGLFESHFLKFFIDLQKIKDPSVWATEQHSWGMSLMNKPEEERLRLWEDEKYVPSKKTIETIVHISNHFMSYLKLKDPKEFPSLGSLSPYTRSQMENHEATRVLNEGDGGHFVTDKDWAEIEACLQDENIINGEHNILKGFNIYPFIKLSYEFGLRRSESLAVILTDVRIGGLSVERQLEKMNEGEPNFTITKGKYKRITPYWSSFAASQLYELVSKIGKGQCKIIHPDTLTDKWKAVMRYLLSAGKIEFNYDIHDLRRTFITKALRDHAAKDVMSAVGHKNIETTMLYLVDERTIETDVYKPPKSA